MDVTAGNSYLHETEAVVNGPITCGRVNATKLYRVVILTRQSWIDQLWVSYRLLHKLLDRTSFKSITTTNTQVVLNQVGGYSDRHQGKHTRHQGRRGSAKIRALQPKTYIQTEPERGLFIFHRARGKSLAPCSISDAVRRPFDTMINANLTSNPKPKTSCETLPRVLERSSSS